MKTGREQNNIWEQAGGYEAQQHGEQRAGYGVMCHVKSVKNGGLCTRRSAEERRREIRSKTALTNTLGCEISGKALMLTEVILAASQTKKMGQGRRMVYFSVCLSISGFNSGRKVISFVPDADFLDWPGACLNGWSSDNIKTADEWFELSSLNIMEELTVIRNKIIRSQLDVAEPTG